MSLTWWLVDSSLSYVRDNTFVALLGIFVALMCARFAQVVNRDRKLPPGPWGIPLLGYLPFMGESPHIMFQKMHRKYGSTFSFRFGSQLVVVLSEYKTIRAAFRRDGFQGRPTNAISDIIQGFGLLNVDGKLWRDQRKFIHQQLRNFGMLRIGGERCQLEKRIMLEVELLLSSMISHRGRPVNMSPHFAVSVGNVICSLVMDVRFTIEDPRFQRFTYLIEEGFRLCTSTGAANFIPSLMYLPTHRDVKMKIKQNRAEMNGFYKNIVEQHKATFDPTNIRDVVDCYLLEIENAKAEGREDSLFEGRDPDCQIYQIIGDLYSAGMETVKTTLNWMMVYMLHHPEVLKNVQNELDRVVGRDRLPTLEDRVKLPYTDATIHEVLRRTCVVPLGTTHSTTKDVELGGYTIPKNAHVIPLLACVSMNDELWEDPEEFNPNRFINDEGSLVKPEYMMPFGEGRRKCLGEIIAEHETFLFFSCLAHCFDLQPVEGRPLPDLIGIAGVTISPTEFELHVIPRHDLPYTPKKPGNNNEYPVVNASALPVKPPTLVTNSPLIERFSG